MVPGDKLATPSSVSSSPVLISGSRGEDAAGYSGGISVRISFFSAGGEVVSLSPPQAMTIFANPRTAPPFNPNNPKDKRCLLLKILPGFVSVLTLIFLSTLRFDNSSICFFDCQVPRNAHLKNRISGEEVEFDVFFPYP